MKKTLSILIIGVTSVVVFCSAAYFGVYGTTPPCESALVDSFVERNNANFEIPEGEENVLRSISLYADKTPLECLIELSKINYEKLQKKLIRGVTAASPEG
jgi:hypothetical protein